MNPTNPSILLTIDVEDWFQVENFKPWIPFSSWPSYELRVEKNTHRLLDLLDLASFKFQVSSFKISATFFVLGWLAERLPHLVREIHSRGPPSFSINNDILKVIEDCGYLYDSSFNSFGIHRRYGHVDLSENEKRGIAARISNTFYEIPISNIELGKQVLPWGGGGYFRLIPLPLFKLGVQSSLKKRGAYLFYMHPWEIDPEQPKFSEASFIYKFRHYLNLNKTQSKLSSLIERFKTTSFVPCRQYLKDLIN
jgi:hypothetical protein